MDKLVKRVTVVQGSGEHRQANVVYRSEEEEEEAPGLDRFEKAVRHMLKAQVIGAQEAYQRHLASAGKGGTAWLFDEPENLRRASRKAMKEVRKASPFRLMKFDEDENEDEDDTR
jgi:hypothetical protein